MKFDIVHFFEEINKPFEIESADPSDIYLQGIILPYLKAIPLKLENIGIGNSIGIEYL